MTAQQAQKTFHDKVRRALSNTGTRRNYRKALDSFAIKRHSAFSALPNQGEDMRNEAHKLRLHSIEHNVELIAELCSKLQANGIHVHRAATAENANEQITKLLKAAHAKTIVKGKSMITEEIQLNAYLQREGFSVIETDLGEYIVQLAGETPAHIVAPIIYKNKAQVAQTLSQNIDPALATAEAETLTAAARLDLRQAFATADAGITGVNFAVAETGTLCLVENEGNGRFCSTLPPLHIAIMSLEKVVAKMASIPLLYELLTRSASGQAITTYFNMISGPRRVGEHDGPHNVHLIILDNGRNKLLKDPLLKQTLLCIRCGACLNSCPVYTVIGGHAYDAVIPGPIGKLLMPQLQGMARYGHLPTASSLCGACVDVCPVKIPITTMLLALRKQYRQQQSRFHERLIFNVWAFIASHPRLYQLNAHMIARIRVLLPLFARFLPITRSWTSTRAFPKPSAKPFL